LCNKSTAYNEEPNTEPYIRSPFHTSTVVMENGDVFEAEVVRKAEYRGTRSAFKSSTFEWEKGEGASSKRYGTSGGTRHSTTNNAPIVPYDNVRFVGGDA
jgi:hypothetical protein